MTKPQPFTCYLCSRAGRPTLAPRAKLRSHLCEDCMERVEAAGLVWCNVGRHRVERREWNAHTRKCRACAAAYAKRYRATNSDYRARQIEKLRAWRHRHPDYAQRAQRSARERNPVSTSAYNRKRYATDPAFRAWKRAYNRMYNARYRKKQRTSL